MKTENTQRGFTLIEILVVILIVAVLAAIAVPQYQKAVLKSRYSAMIPVAKQLAEGNEVYYMEYGNYSEDPTKLVVQGKAQYPDGTNILMYDDNKHSYVRTTNDNVPNARYLVYQKHSANFADTTMCEAGDARANTLCQALGGQIVEGGNSSAEEAWTAYLLTGSYGSADKFPKPTCGGVEQPDDIVVNSNKKGTATCVNGQWKYEWTGGKTYSSNRSSPMIVCSGSPEYACAGNTYSGNNTICSAQKAGGCADSTFTGEYSSCHSYFDSGCSGSIFRGKRSSCTGVINNGCSGAIIQAGAHCLPSRAHGCDGALYGEDPTGKNKGMGSCYDYYSRCPNGVPLTDMSWNNTAGSYNITGWKGNCCNPAYMTSGVCPSGIKVCSN